MVTKYLAKETPKGSVDTRGRWWLVKRQMWPQFGKPKQVQSKVQVSQKQWSEIFFGRIRL